MWKMTITDRYGAATVLARHPEEYTHLVTIGQEGPVEGHERVARVEHFDFADLAVDRKIELGNVVYRPPGEDDVRRLVAMAHGLKDTDHVLIHCHAGISRSTAAAYIMACVTLGEGKEAHAWHKVLTARDIAAPNKRMVRLADSVLMRGCKMLDTLPMSRRGGFNNA